MASPKWSGSLESMGSQRRDQFVNLERIRDRHMAHTHNERAPSMHSKRFGQHQGSHNSHDEEVYNLKKKVGWLRWQLHRKTWIRKERTPTPGQSSSSESDGSYRPLSRTLPNESFMSSSHHTSGGKHYRKRSRTPLRRSHGNDAMGKAFLQISRSPFSRHIEQAELPQHLN